MIREKEAIRVEQWVADAVKGGGRIVTGGVRKGAMYAPTIVADVKPEMRISCEELFGPAVAFTPFNDIEEAIALANDSRFGLAAGVFTESVDTAMKFARELETGNIHINWGPAVACRPNALRGTKRQRFRQGGSPVRGRGNDRVENGGLSPEKLNVLTFLKNLCYKCAISGDTETGRTGKVSVH